MNKNVHKLLKPEVALQKPHANLVSQLLQTDKSMCFPSTCPYHTSRKDVWTTDRGRIILTLKFNLFEAVWKRGSVIRWQKIKLKLIPTLVKFINF